MSKRKFKKIGRFETDSKSLEILMDFVMKSSDIVTREVMDPTKRLPECYKAGLYEVSIRVIVEPEKEYASRFIKRAVPDYLKRVR